VWPTSWSINSGKAEDARALDAKTVELYRVEPLLPLNKLCVHAALPAPQAVVLPTSTSAYPLDGSEPREVCTCVDRDRPEPSEEFQFEKAVLMAISCVSEKVPPEPL
jgi:hypothetical protein